jgi:molecular chaperone GrpE (heat shock protein)
MFRDPFDPFGGWARPPRQPRAQPPPRGPAPPPIDPWFSPPRRTAPRQARDPLPEPRSERPEPLSPARRFHDESPFYRARVQPPVRQAAPAEPPGAWERQRDEHARDEERPPRPSERPHAERQRADAPTSDDRPAPIATNNAELALRRATEELEAQKRRMEREQQRTLEETRAQVAAEMLPVLDNLDRSIAAAGSAAEGEAALLEGIRLVRNQFEEALGRVGLTRIASEGLRFDPAIHDAVGLVEVGDPSQDGTIVDEWQRGYRLGARVIRPAKVRVAKLATS